jgi:UTP-glucose-1-phosphate uridylyltransferase
MNTNSCGKGLAVFSLTLVLSVGIASSFISETEFTELPQTNAANQEVFVYNDKPQHLLIFQQSQKSDKERLSGMISCSKNFSAIYKDLFRRKRELNQELALEYSAHTEKEIENIERQIQIVKDLEFKQKNSK